MFRSIAEVNKIYSNEIWLKRKLRMRNSQNLKIYSKRSKITFERSENKKIKKNDQNEKTRKTIYQTEDMFKQKNSNNF